MSPAQDDPDDDDDYAAPGSQQKVKRRKIGWTNTEDLTILAAVRRIGTQWQRIADEVWADLGLMRQRRKGTVRDDNSWDIVQDLVHLGVGVNFRLCVLF